MQKTPLLFCKFIRQKAVNQTFFHIIKTIIILLWSLKWNKVTRTKNFTSTWRQETVRLFLQSQGYASKASAKNGIESVRKNCLDDACFDIKEAKNGKVYFTLLAKNKQIIGQSQMYSTKAGMNNGVQSVRKNAPEAVVVDLSVEG